MAEILGLRIGLSGRAAIRLRDGVPLVTLEDLHLAGVAVPGFVRDQIQAEIDAQFSLAQNLPVIIDELRLEEGQATVRAGSASSVDERVLFPLRKRGSAPSVWSSLGRLLIDSEHSARSAVVSTIRSAPACSSSLPLAKAAQHPNRPGPGSAGSANVHRRVAHHQAALDRHPQLLGRMQQGTGMGL